MNSAQLREPLPLEEAQARLLALVAPLPIERVDVASALGRYLAAPLRARRTQPAANVSAMDGYAVRAADLAGPWRIVGESAAGHPFPGTVGAGEAVRIATGAVVPAGAEAVIVQEDVVRNGVSLTLTGTAAIDATGNTGNNKITGNAAANISTGGAGRDTMSGKLGTDTFDFNAITESTPDTKHDVITDFAHTLDKIDLSTIDADITTSGNGAFNFLAVAGTALTKAGDLHFFTAATAAGTSTFVEGDVTGDGVADFQIELIGSINLSIKDFIL